MKLALTKGFGNADAIISEVTFKLTRTKRIGRELKRFVKAYSGVCLMNDIWIWTELPDGKIVIDYGSHGYFGLIYDISDDERKILMGGEKP